MFSCFRSFACFFAVGALAVLPATAQCELDWIPGEPVRDVVGGVTKMVSWDPDGAGPAGFATTICGTFTVGTIADGHVAHHDGTTWHSVGTPPDASPSAMIVHGGQLIVAFNTFPAVIAAWNGSTWQTIGTISGPGSDVNTFTVYQGALVAAGNFGSIDGVAANGIAQWNGSSWSALGAGVTGTVRALAVFNGSLHVGGNLTAAGGAPVICYAIWNGGAWAPAPTFNGTINTFAVRNGTSAANSFLFAGGTFGIIGPIGGGHTATRVARFSPATNSWTGMGNDTDECTALLVRSTGITGYEVVAARYWTGTQTATIQRWNGTAWASLGPGLQPARIGSFLYTAGTYTVGVSGGIGEGAVRTLVGTEWQSVTSPGTDLVTTRVLDGGNDVVIAGAFGVLRGGPGAWNPLGSGVVGTVHALARMPNGDIVVGGALTQAGGNPAGGLARWNGSTWSSFAGGVNGTVSALRPLPNGELLVGGLFSTAGGVAAANIARWTGSAWLPLGGGTNGEVRALLALANGDVVAGGAFTFAGTFTNSTPRIARWTGASWLAMTTGSGFNGTVEALALDASGQLLAGGLFTMHHTTAAPYLARWNGSNGWSFVPSGAFAITDIVPLPEGDCIVQGGGWISRTGTPLVPYLNGDAADIDITSGGDVLAAGSFTVAGDVVSQGFARLRTSCPATVAQAGGGCVGSALTATTLPWVGGAFRALANGLPAPAFALAVTGFAPVLPPLPLAAVLPQALPGCALHVTADVVDVAVALGGTTTSQLVLPPTLSLVGATFRHQVVALQVNASATIIAATATNALLLTIGAL
jgi:trimeric autotransporter adhesin